MKPKKSSKKHRETDSSSGSESAESSSSESESSDTSPVSKKSKKAAAKKHSKVRKEKVDDSGEARSSGDDKQSKAKQVPKRVSDNDTVFKAKREAMEQSRWDSPAEKSDKRPKKIEKPKQSDSEGETDERKKRRDKNEEDERRNKIRKDDRSTENKRERNVERGERYHERYDRRFDNRNRNNRQFNNSRGYNNRFDNRRDNYNRDRRNDNYADKKHERDRSNSRDQNRNRKEEHSHSDKEQSRHSRDKRRRSRSSSFNHGDAKWGKDDDGKSGKQAAAKEKEKPNFALSGKLTEERNTYKGVVIKYSEPPEARKPKRRWRLYPFKGEKAMQTLYIHRESAYLIGRDRKVVDLPVDHPSCSKQHAVLQYRLVPFTRDDGSGGKRVRPYLIDLESANGTFINNKKIDSKKYVELLEKDVIKFGYSSREYVLLHENSKDEAQDDDVKLEEEVAVKKEEEAAGV